MTNTNVSNRRRFRYPGFHNNARRIPILLLMIISLSVAAFSSSISRPTLIKNVPWNKNKIRLNAVGKDRIIFSENLPNSKKSTATGVNTNQKNNNESTSALSVSAASNLSRRGGGFSQLSKVRNAIFPIYGKNEITKFLLLGTMKFFIIFVLTLTRDTKDTLIVTQCGAEAIAFLKVRLIVQYMKMS